MLSCALVKCSFHNFLSRILTSFILKKLVCWRTTEVKVSWGVCDFINYLTQSFFHGLCPLGKLLLGFSWIEKGGLFLNVALFVGPQYTESVDGKQRKSFYVVSYSDEPCLEMVIIFSVGLKMFWLGRGWGGVEIRTCNTCCLRDIKAMETVITVFYNQNSCKCLQEGLTLYNDKKGNIWKGAWSWSWGDLTYQPIFRQTYWGLLGCGNGVINNEFIIYTACSP